jgi:hypothetical protein
MHQSLLSFNSGELSPYLRHRSDFAKHASGAERMENFLPMSYGAFQKRPGTQFVADVGDAGGNLALVPFVAAAGEQYLLLFQPDTLTVLSAAGVVKATLDFLVGYDWDASAASLRDVQVVQLNDVAFITHPACAPMRLSRWSDASWTLLWMAYTAAPTLDANTNRAAVYSVASNPVAATWVAGHGYAYGDVCFVSSEWFCTVGHTASAVTNKPGVGSGWKGFWRRKMYGTGDPVTLIAADRTDNGWTKLWRTYSEGTVVDTAWDIFPAGDPGTDTLHLHYHWAICLVSHTSSAGSFTPEDVPTAEKWAIVASYDADNTASCKVGAYRETNTGVVYRCKVEHIESVISIVPGETTGWETYWDMVATGVSPESFTYYGWFEVGDEVSNDGRRFRCTVRHQPSDTNEPGTGANWLDYWLLLVTYGSSSSMALRGPGQYYRISPERDLGDSQVELAGTPAMDGHRSPEIVLDGGWDFFTFGTWRGTFTLERSIDAGVTWTALRSWQSTGDRNVAESGIEDAPTMMRIGFAKLDDTAAEGSPRAVLIPRLPYVTGYALLDRYVSATEMTGVAVSPMLSGSTHRWAQGAFSDVSGFPRSIALHERRLLLASTPNNPVSLWASASDDMNNFETGTADGDALFVTLAANASAPIHWMVSQRRLFLGTPLGEWICGSDTADVPLTPTSFQARQFTAYGSTSLQPVAVGDSLFFPGRNGARVWEMSFSADGYAGEDLSRYAEHLTQAGVVAAAYQAVRSPGLWSITTAGTLLHLAHDRGEQLIAWSRHTTLAGLFRAVAVLPGVAGDDEVFFVVDRGGTALLEKFPTGWQAAREAGAPDTVADARVTLTPTGGMFALPAHLQADPLVGFSELTVDGVAQVLLVERAAFSSTFTLSPVPDTLTIGLPVTSTLTLLPIDTQTDTGTTNARMKRAQEMVLNLHRSRGGQVVYDGEANDLQFSNTGDLMGTRADDFTGWLAVTLSPAHVTDLVVSMRHADAYPFTCLAAVLRWGVHEP